MAARWVNFVSACDPVFPSVPPALIRQLGDPTAWVIARACVLMARIVTPDTPSAREAQLRLNALRWARIELAEHANNEIGELLVHQVENQIITAREAVASLNTVVPALTAHLLQ
jgi:hypothetical protein